MDEYRLTTKRGRERGEYLTELTYNGEKIDFAPSDDLKEIMDMNTLNQIRILANFPQFDNLEFKFSEKDLK